MMMGPDGMMMDPFGPGPGGLLWMLVLGALLVIPFWRLLPQFAMPSWLALIAVIPFAALVLLWVMAFRGRAREVVQ